MDCPLKEKCQRYTSYPEQSQAYLIPLDYLDGECEDYIHDEIVI